MCFSKAARTNKYTVSLLGISLLAIPPNGGNWMTPCQKGGFKPHLKTKSPNGIIFPGKGKNTFKKWKPEKPPPRMGVWNFRPSEPPWYFRPFLGGFDGWIFHSWGVQPALVPGVCPHRWAVPTPASNQWCLHSFRVIPRQVGPGGTTKNIRATNLIYGL